MKRGDVGSAAVAAKEGSTVEQHNSQREEAGLRAAATGASARRGDWD